MGEFSIFHWLIVLAIVLIFFGGRRIPEGLRHERAHFLRWLRPAPPRHGYQDAVAGSLKGQRWPWMPEKGLTIAAGNRR